MGSDRAAQDRGGFSRRQFAGKRRPLPDGRRKLGLAQALQQLPEALAGAGVPEVEIDAAPGRDEHPLPGVDSGKLGAEPRVAPELAAEKDPPAPAPDLERPAEADAAAGAAADAPRWIEYRQQPRVRHGALAAGVQAAHALVADLGGVARLGSADQAEIGDLWPGAGIRAVGDGDAEFVPVLEPAADQRTQARPEIASEKYAVQVGRERVVGRRPVRAAHSRPLAGLDPPTLELVHKPSLADLEGRGRT